MKKIFVLMMAVLAMSFVGCTVIQPDERGVAVNMGEIKGDIIQPGTFWHSPVTDVKVFSIVPQSYEVSFSCGSDGAVTKDMQTVGSTISVKWAYEESRIKEIVTTYSESQIKSTMRDAVKGALKETVGKYSIYDLVQKQGEIIEEVSATVLSRMAEYPVKIASCQILNWDWADSFNKQIEETNTRRQQVLQAEQEALVTAAQAQKKVKEAEAQKQAAELEAQAQIAKARGEAEAVKIKADASAYEAQKIAQNQSAYQRQWDYEIALEKAKRWNGKEVPDSAYIVPGTGAVVPLK